MNLVVQLITILMIITIIIMIITIIVVIIKMISKEETFCFITWREKRRRNFLQSLTLERSLAVGEINSAMPTSGAQFITNLSVLTLFEATY